MNNLGVIITTFATDLSFPGMAEIGRIAEDLGYDRIYTTESLTDTLACDMLIALRTERIVVGSFVALIYNRHPHIAALAATTISDASGGRFILGLGLGHPPRVRAMGLTMGKPSEDLRRYTLQVRGILHGEVVYPDLPVQTYQGRRLQFRTPMNPVPVYTAAVGVRMAELGGEISDGIMMHLVPRSRLPAIREAVARGAQKAGRNPRAIELNLGLHTLVADDLELARQKARESLTYWVGLPSYNQSIRDTGFVREADALRDAFARGDQAALRAHITDEIIDEFCLVGPPERCKERIAAFREAGADFIALQPDPVFPGEDYPSALERTLKAMA
jgi:alkanesulfonate monooxygenase SsuD/methylene tetrahydromethanopterin reductase-like flavin-dependent oxidoreductase (luciferase family)